MADSVETERSRNDVTDSVASNSKPTRRIQGGDLLNVPFGVHINVYVVFGVAAAGTYILPPC